MGDRTFSAGSKAPRSVRQLPLIVGGGEITQLEDTRLHGKAEIGGQRKEWDAEIVEQTPDQRMAWTSRSYLSWLGTRLNPPVAWELNVPKPVMDEVVEVLPAGLPVGLVSITLLLSSRPDRLTTCPPAEVRVSYERLVHTLLNRLALSENESRCKTPCLLWGQSDRPVPRFYVFSSSLQPA